MVNTIIDIENSASLQQWDQARTQSAKLKEQWASRKLLYAFNYAESDYSTLDQLIQRIDSQTQISDQVTVLTDCRVAKSIYQNMNRLIPEP